MNARFRRQISVLAFDVLEFPRNLFLLFDLFNVLVLVEQTLQLLPLVVRPQKNVKVGLENGGGIVSRHDFYMLSRQRGQNHIMAVFLAEVAVENH